MLKTRVSRKFSTFEVFLFLTVFYLFEIPVLKMFKFLTVTFSYLGPPTTTAASHKILKERTGLRFNSSAACIVTELSAVPHAFSHSHSPACSTMTTTTTMIIIIAEL
jgi:hypothetical protein